MMETALRELLVERKLVDPGEFRRQIEVLDSRTPALTLRKKIDVGPPGF
jgi:nitrile hydratase